MATVSNNTKYKLSDFILQDFIGSGTFGKVFRVKDKRSQQIYAAKISNTEVTDIGNELYLNISREVNIISRLNHPGIIKFLFYNPIDFKNKKKPVIITEYASNNSLSHLIEHDRILSNDKILTPTRKLILIYGISKAMSYLHSHDILHRDLKADNILLDKYLHPKISDFGLSKVDSNTSTIFGSVKGTPKYISPEIWSHNDYSKASDVYAFSIVAFEILTLQELYPRIGLFTLMNNVINGERPTFDVPLSDAYKSLIERCWSQDPEDRPTFDQISSELENDLKYITDDISVDEYQDYINSINGSKISFNEKKVVISTIHEKRREMREESIIEHFKVRMYHIPYEYYVQLGPDSKEIVKKSEKGESEFQFIVGRSLIEGLNDFPFDLKIGLDYIKKSIKNGNKESLIYYIKMLIKGKYLPQNLEKACKLVDHLNQTENKAAYFNLVGQIFKKKGQFQKSKINFRRSIELGNSDSLYQYAKLLEENLIVKKKPNEIDQYLKMAISKGCQKAMIKYSMKLFRKEKNIENSKNQKWRQLLEIAAKNGYTKANYYIANFLEQILPAYLLHDYEDKLTEYYKRAALGGHVKSMYLYANKINHRGAPKEILVESFRMFKKASDKNYIKATYRCGLMLLVGDGIPPDGELGSMYIKIAADNGHPIACETYARLLRNGTQISADPEQAVEYYLKAISKGNSDAALSYGAMLENGHGIPVDLKRAAKYYEIGANLGNIDAINCYARMLADGKGIKRNADLAIQYLRIAIDEGDSDAMCNYAYIYHYGKGVPIDTKISIKYFKMAIQKGNSRAMNIYATINLKGEEVPVDYQKAIKYYKMAINKGDRNAMNGYAYMLENGFGTPKDFKGAAKYYKMAIDRGDPAAMHNYAHFLVKGLIGPPDYRGAVKYFKMGIDKGDVSSMNDFAFMLSNDLGIPVDYQKAIKYYKMAIDKGDPEAMNNYGSMLQDGQGVPVDYVEAAKYYKMAGDKGSFAGMNNYACFCRDGKGVPVNYKEAIKYFKMAIAMNKAPNPMNHLAMMLKNGQGCNVDYNAAIKYLKMAIDMGFPPAMNNYALMLYKGEGVDVNKNEAAKYFRMAISNDYVEAMLNYGKMLVEMKKHHSINEGMRYLKRAAQKGNVDAMYEYANMLIKLNMVDEEAIFYLQKASELGHQESKKLLQKILN